MQRWKWHVAGDTFMFQQDSASAHRARETVLPAGNARVNLSRSVAAHQSRYKIKYKIWRLMQERAYKTPVGALTS